MPIPQNTRALPGNLNLENPAPFMCRWNYATEWGVADIVSDVRFFLPVRSNLRPGDQITIAKYKDGRNFRSPSNRIEQIVKVMVIETGPTGIELLVLPPGVMHVGFGKSPSSEVVTDQQGQLSVLKGGGGTVKWNGPSKLWSVILGDEEVCAGIKDKAEAQEIADGKRPMPQKPAAVA